MPSPGAAVSRRRRLACHIVAAGMVAGFWALCFASRWNKSPTFDEPAHITGGYSYWVRGDYRLHTENGVLPQRLAALPLLLSRLRFDIRHDPAWDAADVYAVSRSFFYTQGNDPTAMLRSARAVIVTVSAALAVLIYVLAFRRYGPAGGLIALAAFVLSPTFLAHGGLATSDLVVSLTFLMAVVLFWRAIHTVSLLTLAGSGAAVGLLLVSKSSGLLIGPMALAMVALQLIGRQPVALRFGRRHVVVTRAGRAAVLAGVCLLHVLMAGAVVWAFYGLRYSAFATAGSGQHLLTPWPALLAEIGGARGIVAFARDHHLLPEAYLHGIAYTLAHADNRLAFMNGSYSAHGWRWFFPFCFLVKNPLALLGLMATAAGAAARRLASRRRDGQLLVALGRGLYRNAPLWILIAVYGLAAVFSRIDIGHRHIMPVYPPLFVLTGAAAFWLGRRRWRLPIAGLLVWLAAETALAFPDYIPYFNRLVGGSSQGYRHLVDSSLDWGQDLPALRRWLQRNRSVNAPAYFSYFGSADPSYYGITAIQLPSFFDLRRQRPAGPLLPGTYCISASMLQLCRPDPAGPWNRQYEAQWQRLLAASDQFDRTAADPAARQSLLEAGGPAYWEGVLVAFDRYRFARLCAYLRNHVEPADQIGHSILVYRLSQRDLDQVLRGPPPELRERVPARE